MKDPNELVQYIIVNKDLNMSPGKIAAQVGHVCTICSIEEDKPDPNDVDDDGIKKLIKFNTWYSKGQKKIILEGHQNTLEKLEKDFYAIRDFGLTEIESNSLTAISLGVLTRAEAEPYIKRLQLLK